MGQGHTHRTKRRVKGGNKTGLIAYPLKEGEVLLKSRMRENLKSGSVRGLIAASGRRWLLALLDDKFISDTRVLVEHAIG